LVIFFSYFTYPNLSKILNIFVVLYCTDYRFYQRILENSWISIKKIRDTLNTKKFHNSIVYYLLFLFFSIFDIFFSILPVYGFQKNFKFLCWFIVWIRDVIKNFLHNYGFFKKKIDILEIQNFNKIPLFTISFLFFSIFGILFCISPIQTCRYIMKFFIVFYWKG